MAEVDLHLHTTFSDGMLTPRALVRLCADRGLRVIAVTDHDSTEGIDEAMSVAAELEGLTVIVGIELSTDVPDGEIHVLGYYVDHRDPAFQRTLSGFRDGRAERGRRMVDKLAGLGVKVSWERVKELSDGGAIGRPHIAQAMVEGGYIEYPRDAFDKYIGRDGPAYVERARLAPVEAVRTLAENGALPVMAHPTYSMAGSGPDEVAKLRRTLSELKEAGLVGMEVHYGAYTPEQVEFLATTASELGLVACGGSDYHASGNPDEPEPGSAGPPLETVEVLRSLQRKATAP